MLYSEHTPLELKRHKKRFESSQTTNGDYLISFRLQEMVGWHIVSTNRSEMLGNLTQWGFKYRAFKQQNHMNC